jgi:hypothetical protein
MTHVFIRRLVPDEAEVQLTVGGSNVCQRA